LFFTPPHFGQGRSVSLSFPHFAQVAIAFSIMTERLTMRIVAHGFDCGFSQPHPNAFDWHVGDQNAKVFALHGLRHVFNLVHRDLSQVLNRAD
jgi:hypothetical protein